MLETKPRPRAQQRARNYPIPGQLNPQRANPRPPANQRPCDDPVDRYPDSNMDSKATNVAEVQDILPGEPTQSQYESSAPVFTPRPVWDRTRRELRIAGKVVKRFKWPAGNQESVLNAFEEEGWPDRIDDPICQHPEICAKQRLNDAIKCLNRKQVNPLIKFRGDGTGRGVRLEINLK